MDLCRSLTLWQNENPGNSLGRFSSDGLARCIAKNPSGLI